MSNRETFVIGWTVGVLLGLAFVRGCGPDPDGEEEARARAVRTADAWLRYTDDAVRAVACRPDEDDGTTCAVLRSSGLAVTIRCDTGRTWDCSPSPGERP